MADATVQLLEYLGESGFALEDDLLRVGLQAVAQALIEAEVARQIGSERYERSTDRLTQRHGCRARMLEIRVGELELGVPKMREDAGSSLDVARTSIT